MVNNFADPPPDPLSLLAAQCEQQDLAIQRILQTLHQRDDGLQALGQATAELTQRVEAMAAAEPSAGVEPVLLPPPFSYEPTAEQAAQLFAALAEWQVDATNVTKGDTAEVPTKRGGLAKYSYANLADTLQVARTAGSHGLSLLHRIHRIGRATYVEGILCHKGGGYLSSGPVRLTTTPNSLTSPMQQMMSAVTTARRISTQMLLGVAAAEDDNDASDRPRSQQGPPSSPVPPPGTYTAAPRGPAAANQATTRRQGSAPPPVRRPPEGGQPPDQTTTHQPSGATR